MKKIIMLLLAVLPLMASAQVELTPEQELEKAQKELEEAQKKLAQARERAQKAQQNTESKPQNEAPVGWTVPTPEEETAADRRHAESQRVARQTKAEEQAPYLAADAVPLVDGRVEWSCTVSVPGVSADVLYARCKDFLNTIVRGELARKESRIALLNAQERSLIATMRESMTIQSTYLSLNHPTFCYALQVRCATGTATLTMSRVAFNYDVKDKAETLKAEEWITDDVALNENHTRLLPLTGKLRRATIDRKDALFEAFGKAIAE